MPTGPRPIEAALAELPDAQQNAWLTDELDVMQAVENTLDEMHAAALRRANALLVADANSASGRAWLA
jgi:hypothetical protein